MQMNPFRRQTSMSLVTKTIQAISASNINIRCFKRPTSQSLIRIGFYNHLMRPRRPRQLRLASQIQQAKSAITLTNKITPAMRCRTKQHIRSTSNKWLPPHFINIISTISIAIFPERSQGFKEREVTFQTPKTIQLRRAI